MLCTSPSATVPNSRRDLRENTKERQDILLEMKDVKSELPHVRELIGVLVRKEKCAETRAEIAASDWIGWNKNRTSKTTKKVKPTCKKLSVTRPKP